MEANTSDVRSGVAVVHSSSPELSDRQLWTRESIDPRISVTMVEIDVQSAQYSCEVTITNAADEEFSVSAVRPRLPKGVSLNEAVDSAQVAAVKRYEEICRSTGGLLTSSVLLEDKDIAIGLANDLRDQMRVALKPRNLFEIYFYPLIGRMPKWAQAMRERSFKVEVASASDAESALESFPLGCSSSNRKLIEYNIALLKGIERNQDFQRTRSQEISLKKGQQYKAIYIICGTRGALNPTSYSISFDVVLRRDQYSLSRVEYVTVTVPPAPFWPTVVSMASAAIGSLIQSFGGPTAAATAAAAIEANEAVRPAFDFLSASPLSVATTLIVPMLTALIVYNIYDMTILKDRIKTSRSWRSAVFIGFLCGFLNEKILVALGTLLG